MVPARTGARIIWVASYPKSGNTWMRFLLTRLIEGKLLVSGDVDAFIPEAAAIPGQRLVLPGDGVALLKTHWEMTERIELMRETLGFVYLVRNPLDVMVSLFHFNQLRYLKGEQTAEQQEASLRRYIEAFIAYKGNPLRGSGGGQTSWIGNIESWLRAGQHYPHVFVRYENMLEDPINEVKRVLAFFHLQITRNEIVQAVEESSFKAMKKLEEKEIKKKQSGFFFHEDLSVMHQRGSRFMRSGKAGEGRRQIRPDQLARFIQTFGVTMERVGYEIKPNTGAVRIAKEPVGEIVPLQESPTFRAAVIQHTQP